MRPLQIALLMVAGCAVPRPQDDLVLFEDAGERARRDLLAVYYSEASDGTVLSVILPRRAPAEARCEISPEVAEALSRVRPRRDRRWRKEAIPVAATHREAIDGIFAGLPAGDSARTLPEPESDPGGVALSRILEHILHGRIKVRILHVSGTGEVKTLTLFKGKPSEVPPGVPAAGANLSTLDKMFLWFADGSPR